MRLTAKEKYSFGIGAFGKDLAYNIIGTYFMFYLTDVLGIGAAFIGGLFFVARMWDAVNDPMMGLIVDNTRTRFGKFRPWIMIGTLINAVVIVLVFTDFKLEGTALYAYVAFMYILWGMTYTLMDVPYWSMLPNLTSDKREREQISVIPRIFASLGGLFISTQGLKLVALFGKGDQKVGFFWFAVLVSVIFVITIAITFFNTKEHNTSENQEKTTLKQMLNVLIKNDQLMAFFAFVLLTTMGQQIVGAIQLYYFKYVTGDEGLFTTFALYAGLANMAGMFIFPMMVKKLSRVKVLALGCIVPILGMLILLIAGIVAPQNPILIAISGIVWSFGGGFFTGSQTVALADVVDYGEYKLGTRNESVIFSMQTLLVKVSSAFGGVLTGIILTVTGYVPNAVQSEATINGIRLAMTVGPMVFILLSLIVYKKAYKLNGDLLEKVMLTLEEKRRNSSGSKTVDTSEIYDIERKVESSRD